MYKRLSRFMQYLATSGKSSGKSSNAGTYTGPMPKRLRRALEKQFPIGGRITGENRGGYIVEIDNFEAFCPYSEMYQPYLLLPDPTNPKKKQRVFEFIVLKIEGRSCILSMRKALKFKTLEKINNAIRDKSLLIGSVKTIMPYGAFIDLGGIDGLLHISEIPIHLKGTSGVILKINNKVSVYVINIDNSKNRVSLSMLGPTKSTNRIPELV